jgi:hypothetical protein
MCAGLEGSRTGSRGAATGSITMSTGRRHCGACPPRGALTCLESRPTLSLGGLGLYRYFVSRSTVRSKLMLKKPDWSDEGEFPQRWTFSGLWASLRILVAGSWQFTQVQMLVSPPNDRKPLSGQKIQEIYLSMLRASYAQKRDA